MTVYPDHFRLDAADRIDGHPGITVTADAPPATAPRYTRIEIGGFRRPAVIAMLAVLFFASVGDFVNAKTVFDLVFVNSASYNAWTLAVSMTVLAILATHTAGYLWKDAHRRHGLRALSVTVLLAWTAAGGLLATLRVLVGSAATSATTPSQPGNPFAGLQPGGSSPHPLAVAAVLAAIWVTTGIVSFTIGYLAHAPAGAALARLEATTEHESNKLGRALRAERRSAHTLAAHRLHHSRLPEAWRQANAAAEAHREQLRAWARTELARLMADPAATNDILPHPTTDPTDDEE